MQKPWELKTETVRDADKFPTFIIFCEDAICEPEYFKFFETDLIKINPIGNQKNGFKNIKNTINYCCDKGIKKYNGDTLMSLDSDIFVWCVYDRDQSGQSDQAMNDIEFNESIKSAQSNGINVAWSNDAFELWILLHFEDVDVSEDTKHREYYYTRLTDIFKNLPSNNKDLQDALKHPSFNYKRDLKSKNNFRNIVRKEIENKIENAISRAKTLEDIHNVNNTPYHEQCPCTKAHHLALELLKHGKKSI